MLRSDEIVTKTEYDWDTATLPEGKYRVRVEASDEAANPPDQVLKHALETSGVLVDNTPPAFHDRDPGRAASSRRASSTASARSRASTCPSTDEAEKTSGGRSPRPIGVFDSRRRELRRRRFIARPAGTHIVAVRAFDAAGNYVVREIAAP